MKSIEWNNTAVLVQQRAAGLSQFDPKVLQRADLDDMGFSSLEDDFQRAVQTAARLVDLRWDAVPGDVLNEVMSAMDSVRALFDRTVALNAVKFAKDTARSSSLAVERQALVTEFQNRLPALSTAAAKAFAFAGAASSQEVSQAFEASIQKQLGEMRDAQLEVIDAAAKASRLRKELEAIVSAARDAAGTVGVGAHAGHFREAADEHEKAAHHWLWATGIAATVAVIAAAYNYAEALRPGASDGSASGPVLGAAYITQLVTAKLILFSLLASAVIWCGRVSLSQKHKKVLDRHHPNALSSFETFVAASGSDEQTKNAVLLEATRSIFAPQPTGYNSAEAENSGPTQMLEIMRTLPGNAGH